MNVYPVKVLYIPHDSGSVYTYFSGYNRGPQLSLPKGFRLTVKVEFTLV